MTDKKSLREVIRRQRSQVAPSVLVYNSRLLTDRAVEIIRAARPRSVLTFVGLPVEPDTRPILQFILADNRGLVLPRVEGGGLSLYRVENLEDQLRPSPPYGIFEPVPDRCEPWRERPIDLALVPGLAFDVRGNRLGHGAGYFDRTLAELWPKPTAYGLAFDFQMRRSVPHDPQDVAVDGVITEERLFRHLSSRIVTHSPEETMELGRSLASTVPADSVLVLSGPLGVGKTVLVKGLAQGLSIQQEIVSLSFTLVKEYCSPEGVLWHADLYRLGSTRETEAGFWAEILDAPGIKAIEWGDRLGDQLPLDSILLEAEILGDRERAWTIITPLDCQSGIHQVVAGLEQ